MNRIAKTFSLFIITLFALPFTLAQPSSGNFLNAFENIGSTLWAIMQDTYAVYTITLIFFTILLYAIYSAGLTKVKIFSGEKGVNRYGKAVAFALAMTSSLGIFAFTESRGGIRELTADILTPFAIYGGVALALVTFMVTYFSMKEQDSSRAWQTASFAAGMAMVFVGMVTTHPNMMWWGWLIVFIALMFLLASIRNSGSGEGSDGGAGDGENNGSNNGNNAGGNNENGDGNNNGSSDKIGPVLISIAQHRGNELYIEWVPAENATSYDIGHKKKWYSPSNWIHYGLLTKVTTVNTSQTITEHVDPEKTYQVWVRGRNGRKKGKWTKRTITPPNAKLEAPILTDPIRINTIGFHLEWSAVPNAGEYYVYAEQHSGGAWGTAQEIGHVGRNTRTCTFPVGPGMTGTLFKFYVVPANRAHRNPKKNEKSNEVTAEIPSGTRVRQIIRDHLGNIIAILRRTYL